jgi:alkylation response protein AidB-like acyl-CoA dehydrogenase
MNTTTRDEVIHDSQRLEELLVLASTLADRFAERAAVIDRDGTFPYDNFAELKQAGYLALTIPEKYGGKEISLYELVVLQERLGQGDAATALSVGWHLSVLMELSVRQPWAEHTFEKLCQEIVQSKRLINRAATEPVTGSPARGGMPQTTAKKVDGGWQINGRKTFTTMSGALDFIIVTASVEEYGQIGEFLLEGTTPGIRYEETWDTIGMRGTCSHDLILADVLVPDEALVQLIDPRIGYRSVSGWLLHIPACYLGIARAARDYAITFASDYTPNSTVGPIKNLPNVQRLIGEMELGLLSARHFLHSVAQLWDTQPDKRERMGPELAAAKHVVTNTAITVVDQAMRLVGGHSLFRDRPLERYYRDVRAGLHNPPMDDVTLQLLAARALHDWNEGKETRHERQL